MNTTYELEQITFERLLSASPANQVSPTPRVRNRRLLEHFHFEKALAGPDGAAPPCVRRILWSLLVMMVLLLPACASRGSASVNRMLDRVGNMSVARHYLGPPNITRELPGGGAHYEWVIDRVMRESAHYETRQVLIGYDRDGFPVFEDIEYFIPERDVHQTCRIVVTADADDNILEHSAEGSHCQLMFQVPTTY